MKNENKSTWFFVLQKYSKFGRISLGHFIKHKSLISEECAIPDRFKIIFPFPIDYEESSAPLVLKRNHEYQIDINPRGQMSSEGFKKFEVNQRDCLFENEVEISSVFKVYTKNNCKYECYVKNATDTCKCIPWDFIHISQFTVG